MHWSCERLSMKVKGIFLFSRLTNSALVETPEELAIVLNITNYHSKASATSFSHNYWQYDFLHSRHYCEHFKCICQDCTHFALFYTSRRTTRTSSSCRREESVRLRTSPVQNV